MVNNLNLSSSLRPLFIFFYFIGIHLPDVEESGQHSKWIYAGICLLFNVCSQIASIYIILNKIFLFETTGQESLDTVTSALIVAIEYSNYSLAPVICHFIGLTAVRLRWTASELSIPEIWDKLLMWKRCHQLNCQTVVATDHCFGWIL